ncbi:MAG TPA: bifunctional phosphoribosyl-AMP cyclohydrolase/phosphoribosyl-ATP diphosphatase HisIE [Polyangia bacterium]|nr:bifunctional phosphoribosyl-AMP cyclohydrolase/phosphoribosyl-ATP diphosphatase HisIE [Polyangia bacterium]
MSATPKPSDDRRLTPAVVQDALTGRVLMLAYMDDEALARTRETGEVHFWSRSRNALWKKGETSGHTLALVELKADCDADTWLVRAVPRGPTCHTGSETCFGTDGVEPPPSELESLYRTILERKAAPPGTRSYVRTLLENPMRVPEKILEEAGELAVELAAGAVDRERVIAEAADVLFHVLVGLADHGVTLADVERELHRRAGTSGLDEKASRRQ